MTPAPDAEHRSVPGRSARWAGAALCLAAVALRLPQFGESIWYDEFCRTKAYLNDENLSDILLRDVHNPLYNAFMYVWINVFGDSEWSIRFPSLLAGLVSGVVFSAWLGRRFGSAMGWVVAVLLVVSPVHVWYSGEAKNTMFVIAASSLALVTADRAAHTPNLWRFTAAVLAGAAALWTDFVTALVVIPAWWSGLIGVGLGERSAARTRAVAGTIAMVVLCAPLICIKMEHADHLWRGYLQKFNFPQLWKLLFGFMLQGNAIVIDADRSAVLTNVVAAFAVPLLAWGAWRLRGSRSGRLLIAVTVFVPAAFMIVSHAIQWWNPGPRRNIYQARNLVVMLMPYLAVLMAGAVGLPGRRVKWVPIVALVAMNLAGAVLMQTAYRHRGTVMNPNPDWRQVARRLAESEGAAPVVFASKSPVHPLVYYRPGARVEWLSDPAVMFDRLRDLVRSTAATVYYVNDERWSSLTDEEREVLVRRFDARLVVTVENVRVYRVRE